CAIGETGSKEAERRRPRFLRAGAGLGALPTAGRLMPATRWRIEGDIDRTLWYDAEGQFLRVDFVEKDRAFTIRRGVCGGGVER
ncbi:MAG: hypothetical protein AAF684_05300, partial [Pseudomonadota bacterium]